MVRNVCTVYMSIPMTNKSNSNVSVTAMQEEIKNVGQMVSLAFK